jgi:hypothetical protein
MCNIYYYQIIKIKNHDYRYNHIITPTAIFFIQYIVIDSTIVLLMIFLDMRDIINVIATVIVIFILVIHLYPSFHSKAVNLTYNDGLTAYNKKLLEFINANDSFTTTKIPFIANIHLKDDFNDTIVLRRPTILRFPDNNIIGNKKQIWNNIQEYYGTNRAINIMPMSYTFPEQYKQFEQDQKNSRWVLKKNKQRQEGIFIVRNKPTKGFIKKEDIIVAQEYMYNVKLYKKHKVNIRLYMIASFDTFNNKLKLFLSKDGIVSYTPEPYLVNSGTGFNEKNMITSFYDSTKLYDAGFPITIQQLQGDSSFQIQQQSLNDITTLLYPIIKKKLIEQETKQNAKYVELFGIDYLMLGDNTIRIIEINTGPNMKHHNGIDKVMRKQVIDEYLRLATDNNIDSNVYDEL